MTATPDPGFGRVALEVTYAGGDATTATVTCTEPSGAARLVRSMVEIPLAGAAAYDDEPPVEVVLTYTAVVSNDDGDSAPSAPAQVTVDYTATWLKMVAVPSANLALPIVEGIAERKSSVAYSAHYVAGRPHPVVISDVRQAPTSTLTVVTETDTEREAMAGLLATGDVLLFQGDIGEGHFYLLVTDVTEARPARIYSVPARRWVLDFIECEAPLSPLVTTAAGRTYQSVLDIYASYSAVQATYASYLDLLRGTI